MSGVDPAVSKEKKERKRLLERDFKKVKLQPLFRYRSRQ